MLPRTVEATISHQSTKEERCMHHVHDNKKSVNLVLSPTVQFMKASGEWPLPLLEPSFDAAALASHELLNI